jgi:hypothetical protein
LRQDGAIVVFAALDLDELFDQLPVAAIEKALDSSALRFQAKATSALATSGNP